MEEVVKFKTLFYIKLCGLLMEEVVKFNLDFILY